MTFPLNPHDREPRGDKNRRLSLGIESEAFAKEVGISFEDLHDYEHTQPDSRFRIDVAARVGATLERLERSRQPRVDNGPVPAESKISLGSA